MKRPFILDEIRLAHRTPRVGGAIHSGHRVVTESGVDHAEYPRGHGNPVSAISPELVPPPLSFPLQFTTEARNQRSEPPVPPLRPCVLSPQPAGGGPMRGGNWPTTQ